jgi:putative tryptophan/tyrosine transport system substrate-binding protein
MERRKFITIIGGAVLAWPLGARRTAGKPVAEKVVRIGVLGTFPWSAFDGLRDGLHELGYVEGKNLTFEYRWNGGRNDLYPALAAELVALPVDLILTISTPAALAARNATSTIPIVMAPAGDPIKAGLVPNLARPGGNLTGFTTLATEISGKRLELLKQLVPSLSTVAVLGNMSNPFTAIELEYMRPAAATLRISLEVVPAANDEQLGRALEALSRNRPDGVVVSNDQFLLTLRERIVASMAGDKLPAVYGFRDFVDAGGLAYYGANNRLEFRRMADYVDRILNGTKPGDLPVQQPTKFELVVNVKAARLLGLTVPPALLASADEVIE